MKLQQDILKEQEKHEKRGGWSTYFLTTGSDDYLDAGISNGHFIKFYNAKYIYLNFNNLSTARGPEFVFDTKEILKGRDDAYLLTLTDTYKKYNDGKNEARCLTFPDGTKTWINTAFEKYFNLSKNLQFSDFSFYAVNKKTPVFIESRDRVYGLILPLIMQED